MNNKVTGKVLDVKVTKGLHGDLRQVILEDGQCFPTSYSTHSLDKLRQYIGKLVILDISPRGYLFDISLGDPPPITVTLDADIAEVFKDSEAVNRALRAILLALPNSQFHEKT